MYCGLNNSTGNIIYLFIGYDNNSKFIIPQDHNNFLRQSREKLLLQGGQKFQVAIVPKASK